MLASLESRMRKVAAVRSKLYFFMKFLVDLERDIKRRNLLGDTHLKGPRPLDICGEQESVGPPSSW